MKNILIIIWLFPHILLSQSKVNSYDPKWSPDGESVVFYSNYDGDYEIYIIGRDGNDLNKVTDNEISDTAPSWSPDGNKILFKSNKQVLKARTTRNA